MSILDNLTARERQVVSQLATGLSNMDLSRTFKVKECTIKFHLSNIYEKTMIDSDRLLIALYWKERFAKREEWYKQSNRKYEEPNDL